VARYLTDKEKQKLLDGIAKLIPRGYELAMILADGEGNLVATVMSVCPDCAADMMRAGADALGRAHEDEVEVHGPFVQ
jgi:hypothetical protein